MRRLLSRIASGRGAAELAGFVIAATGLALAFADSRHRTVGVLVVAAGVCIWLIAFLWVRLSVAVVETAVEHGVQLGTIKREPEPELAEVARPVRTEVQSIRSRVRAYRSEGQFSRGIHPLPAQRWDEYRSFLARHAPDTYDLLEEAYMRVDVLNHVMVERANLYTSRWLHFHDEDGLDELDDALSEAITHLDQLAS